MINKMLLAAFIFVCSFAFYLPEASAQATNNYSKMSAEILRLLNEHRVGMHLYPLKQNDIIAQSAEQHSRDMAGGKVPFGHDGFDDRTAKISGKLKPTNAFAENVAEGATTAAEVVNMWLHSPGHKKNIEGDYNLTGIGIAKDANGKLYYTQIFIKRG